MININFKQKSLKDPIKILESIAKTGRKNKKIDFESYEKELEEVWKKSG